MDLEEEKKMKIFNSTTPNITTKKRYFRVEKKRFNPDDTKEKDSKKIFKTKKRSLIMVRRHTTCKILIP